jgi:hypothetical protein
VRRPATLAAGALASLALAACGGSASSPSSSSAPAGTTHPAQPAKPKPVYPPYPELLPGALVTSATNFVPAARWQGQTAAWIAHAPAGVSLLSIDQRLATLTLHSGTLDAGPVGWRFGPQVTGTELLHLVAAFNGGFRLNIGAGGFQSYGRVAAPLRGGLGSIVTYSDGYTEIGSWQQEVPASGRHVVAVRQNLNLLIDNGQAAPNADCTSCWGATLGGVSAPARSALGITADGRLIWAGGEHLTASTLAHALLGAKVTRAVELDINPEWVAGYLYRHRAGPGRPSAVQVIPDQRGIPGQLLTPYTRDFFTVTAR